jgi:phosphonate transport system permease protein
MASAAFSAGWLTIRRARRIQALYAWMVGLSLLLAAGIACQRLGIGFGQMLSGFARLGAILAWMLPPDPGGAFALYVRGMIETISLAFLATVLAAIAAIPAGLLLARNTSPHPALRLTGRRLLDILRGIDTLVIALIFVSAIGLGPTAGVLALAVTESVLLAKLVSEAAEEVNPRTVESVRALGANSLEQIRFAVWPEAGPAILSQTLYLFESSVRQATILGMVGAGGIGLQLADRIRVNEWQEAAFILLLILVFVQGLEAMTSALRRRL